MKLEIIGTNSAFVPSGINSSLLLWLDDNNAILMDCGFTVFQQVLKKGYVDKINTVLLSHLHQDHCGSAVTLLEYRHFVLQQLTAIGGTDWSKLLKLCEEKGFGKEAVTTDINVKLETIQVPHGKGMDCLAFLVEDKVLFSGDTAISLLQTPQAAKAKIIIHDAALSHNPTHASLKELGEAPLEIKRKTYLTHYRPQDFEQLQQKALELGFAGVASAGDIFEL